MKYFDAFAGRQLRKGGGVRYITQVETDENFIERKEVKDGDLYLS